MSANEHATPQSIMGKAVCNWIDSDPNRDTEGCTPSMLVNVAATALHKAGYVITRNPDSPEFRAAIRPVIEEWSWVLNVPVSELNYVVTKSVEAAAKSAEGE